MTVTIDTGHRDPELVETDRADRPQARAAALSDKATRCSATAQAAHDKAKTLGEQIPFGQPILIGHHSEGRMRRHAARIRPTSR